MEAEAVAVSRSFGATFIQRMLHERCAFEAVVRTLLLVLTQMVTGCSGSREQKNEIPKGKSKKETKKREQSTESGGLLIFTAPFCAPRPSLFHSSFRPSFNTDLKRRLHE